MIALPNMTVSKDMITRGKYIRTEELRRQVGDRNKGENHGMWNGGRHIDRKGYVRILMHDHYSADSKGYVKEHRFVYEQYYNCCVPTWIDVHHINGNKQDNRIENLMLLPHGKHSSTHTTGKGHDVSIETRKKISETLKKYWMRVRNG